MDRAQLTIFAGDHGITAEGVSAFPQEVTGQMVLNFVTGGAAANVFARSNDVALRVVDAGIAAPVGHADVLDRRAGAGTANAARMPAMTPDQRAHCFKAGAALGTDGECDAVLFGEMGIGNTASATLVAHKITGLPVEVLTGRGTGVDDAGLARKKSVITQAAARTGNLSTAEALLEYAGFEMVMMCGAMHAAASARRLVIVDGFIASASALAVLTAHPDVRGAFVFAHTSAESGHQAILDHLGVTPVLDLNLRLGEGTGALLAWPLIKSAAAMLREMASFESAAVSERL